MTSSEYANFCESASLKIANAAELTYNDVLI